MRRGYRASNQRGNSSLRLILDGTLVQLHDEVINTDTAVDERYFELSTSGRGFTTECGDIALRMYEYPRPAASNTRPWVKRAHVTLLAGHHTTGAHLLLRRSGHKVWVSSSSVIPIPTMSPSPFDHDDNDRTNKSPPARFREFPSLEYHDYHREQLPNWYYATDVDLIELRQDDLTPYLFCEIIMIRSEQGLTDPPSTHPIWPHKQHVYEWLATETGVPAYVLWTTPSCSEFVIQRIDDTDEPARRLTGHHDLCDFLDRLQSR